MKTDLDLDTTGLLCPLPVLKLRKALQPLPSGAVVGLLASDPMAAIDVPAFCTEAGHKFLDSAPKADDVTIFYIQRK